MAHIPRPRGLLVACLLLTACAHSNPPVQLTDAPLPSTTPVPSPLTPTPAQPGWCSPPGRLTGKFLVVGYLPDYRQLELAWGNCLTDLVYFSAEPRLDGSLDATRLDPPVLQQMQEMKARYGTHLHISLGGYGRSDNFGPVVTDPQARRTFIADLLAFAANNDLDGIDFDWEFPADAVELEGYLEVIAAIRQAGLIVSVAIYPYPDLDLAPYLDAVDRVHIMSYDRGPQHATYEQAVADLETFLQAGFDPRQLILGVPFYGRQTTSPYTPYPYADILANYAPLPEQDEVGGIYFNGIATMQRKVCYARRNGFGGVMIWELGQDSPDERSLLRAIYSPLAEGCPAK